MWWDVYIWTLASPHWCARSACILFLNNRICFLVSVFMFWIKSCRKKRKRNCHSLENYTIYVQLNRQQKTFFFFSFATTKKHEKETENRDQIIFHFVILLTKRYQLCGEKLQNTVLFRVSDFSKCVSFFLYVHYHARLLSVSLNSNHVSIRSCDFTYLDSRFRLFHPFCNCITSRTLDSSWQIISFGKR